MPHLARYIRNIRNKQGGILDEIEQIKISQLFHFGDNMAKKQAYRQNRRWIVPRSTNLYDKYIIKTCKFCEF